MRASRVFVTKPLVAGEQLTLGVDEANYLGRVLRARTGDAVVLFDGQGGECLGSIVSLGRRAVTVDVGERMDVSRESPVTITLLQGLSRGERMDFAIQKATELGANAIVPVVTEHTQFQLDAERRERRREHWSGIAIAAAQQCGRTVLPRIEPIAELRDALAAPITADALRLVADPNGSASWPNVQANHIVIAIGPEGGFSANEYAEFRGAEFNAIQLGPRVLRTETATVVALTLAQRRYGDLG